MVSREEAAAKQKELLRPKVEQAEHMIDLMLIKGDRHINVNAVGYTIMNEVMRRYREAGWTVRLVTDQRDGDYLEFS